MPEDDAVNIEDFGAIGSAQPARKGGALQVGDVATDLDGKTWVFTGGGWYHEGGTQSPDPDASVIEAMARRMWRYEPSGPDGYDRPFRVEVWIRRAEHALAAYRAERTVGDSPKL